MSFKSQIPVVIFAGGKSSRMGEDKSLLPFGGFDTLCEYQIDKLSQIFENIYVSCKNRDKFNFEANFIEDISHESSSPVIALYSIFQRLDNFIAISVDTPFITKETIYALTNDRERFVTIKDEPLCAKYDISLLPMIKEMLENDNHKIGLLSKNAKIIDIQNKEEFMNLNYKTDYEKALEQLS